MPKRANKTENNHCGPGQRVFALGFITQFEHSFILGTAKLANNKVLNCQSCDKLQTALLHRGVCRTVRIDEKVKK
jgi:hypothetical protein